MLSVPRHPDTPVTVSISPSIVRYMAVAFAANGRDYVSTGYDGNYQKDFWQRNPTTDTWPPKPSFGSNKRLGATAFTLNNRGFLLLDSDNGVYQTDVWSCHPHNGLLLTLKSTGSPDRAILGRLRNSSPAATADLLHENQPVIL